MASNTYVALQTSTVTGSPAASVTLNSIPSGYTDIVLVISGNNSTAEGGFRIQCNTDTGSNYSWTQMYGDGTNAASNRGSNDTKMTLGRGGTAQSNSIIQFMNYSNTTTYKTVIGRGNAAGSIVQTSVGLWRGTPAAINQLVISNEGGNIAVGTTFTLYGIAAASVGAKATGGTIYQDASYFYHVFSGNGTFTPTSSLTADVLCVAGGGGGGSNRGGGGGAGGLRYLSSQSLSATGYSVTVGSGGAGAPAGTGAGGGSGTVGVNSSFSTTTASGGGYGGGNYIITPVNGGAGGSGGGGGLVSSGTSSGGAGNAGSYSPVEGYAGGNGAAGVGFAGGGGGSGAVGQAATTTAAGAGGTGINTYLSWATTTGTGVSGYYAGGGGGGSGDATAGGVGGAGGGGAGGNSVSNPGINATANTGSGGGGSHAAIVAGNGGSGIVIVRYAK